MTLIDFENPPSDSMKRWFGFSLAGLLFVLAYLIRDASEIIAVVVAAFGVLIAAVYYTLPSTQMSVIRVWKIITYPLAWMISHVLLGTVYFGIVFPMGLILRRFGYDPLRLKKSSTSEWVPRQERRDVRRYFRQF